MQEYIKKILGLGRRDSSSSAAHNNDNTTTLIISNSEMEDIIKIGKSLEDSGLLLKGVTETVQIEIKEQKGGFLSMLGTLGASLLGNILAGQGINKKGQGKNRTGEEIVRAAYANKTIK